MTALHECGERVENGGHVFLVTDGNAQVIGQAVAVDPSDDQALGSQESVGIRGGAPVYLRNDAGVIEPRRMVWPAYWGRIKAEDDVQPIPPDEAQSSRQGSRV